MTLQIAALASGAGSNVAAILARIKDGSLDARMRVILSNNPDAQVLEIAKAGGVPFWAQSHKDYPDREAYDRQLLAIIREHEADTIVLAGYMRMLGPFFIREFPGRILNIHPALLPSFPGLHGGLDALDHGVKLTGATVHFVDETMDSGPIIIQAVVPVRGTDSEGSLMARVHSMEHRIYPQALHWLAEGRLQINGRRVRRMPAKNPHTATASHGVNTLGPWMVCPALEGF